MYAGPIRHMPVQYEVRTAWYNYTRRDGTTYAGILLSRNSTKSRRYMILACDVTPGVRSVVRDWAIIIINLDSLDALRASVSASVHNFRNFPINLS